LRFSSGKGVNSISKILLAMNKIVVCIPTYKRPEMLKSLVISILECNINKSLIDDFDIVIVDNDADKTAESAVKELQEKHGAEHKIEYFAYPVKGLSNVRNELINVGLTLNPDFLIFVDDDEFVSAGWMNEMVSTIISNEGDLVMGPVRSVIKKRVPVSISCWLDRPEYPDNTRLYFIRSGNLIVKVSSLLEYGVRFDPRFNKTGGEDSYFGLKMIQKGASIFWAANAIAYENVPDNRATIKWISKRFYNGANKYAFILRLEKNLSKRIKKLFVSFFYLFVGAIASVMALFPFRKRYWGILKMNEGLGGIAGFLNLRYNEY